MTKDVAVRCLTGFCVSAMLLLPQGVLGHGSQPAGLTPFLLNGEMVGAATNLGLVLYEEGVPTWYSAVQVRGALYWFGYTASGRVLVGTSHTLLATDDGGCSWSAHSELMGGLHVRAMALAPDAPRPFLIGTDNADHINYLYHSLDGGDSWTMLVETELVGGYLSLVRLADEGRYAALSLDADGETYRLHTSNALGDVWTRQVLELAGADEVRLLTAEAGGGSVLLAAFRAEPGVDPPEIPDPMWVAPGVDTLYRLDTTDGTLTELVTLIDSNRFYSGAAFGGNTWVTDFEDRLLELDGSVLLENEDELRYCINGDYSADYLWACGRRPQEHCFYSSQDGVSWQGRLLFDEIVVARCPDESSSSGSLDDSGESVPGTNFGGAEVASGGENSSQGTVKTPADEGCSGLGASPWLLLSVSLLLRSKRNRFGV